jgi:hypothetical protein
VSRLDPETLDRLQRMTLEERLATVRAVCYQAATDGGSDHYMEMLEELVELGMLTWDQIEALESRD